MNFSARDEYWMREALQLAKAAAKAGEVPVGAILVQEDKLIASGHNCPISTVDPSAHAEMVVMRQAATTLNNYRLVNATLYVTLEPCLMCAGAMVHARVNRLVYGASDPRAGAVQSQAQVLDHVFLNHRVAHQGGVIAAECGAILSEFFRSRR